MAEATGVRVEGIAQLVRSLRRVSDQFPKELKRIHRELAEPIADKAKRRVRSRSGRLAASIRPQAGQRYARVAAGRKGLDRRTGYNYAAINHYGGYPGGYSGNPFLTDTLAAEEHRIYRDYERAVVQLIETHWETIP